MVRIPGLQKRKEIEIEKDKQIKQLEKEGWVICGMKSIGKNIVVVFEKDIDIKPSIRS